MLHIWKGNLTYTLDTLEVPNSIPQTYLNKRLERDGNQYHITLIFRSEYAINKVLIDELQSYDKWDHYLVLGLANIKKEVFYLPILWPVVNTFRQGLGLPKKDLHITLGFKDKDIHDVSKGLNTITDWYPETVPFIQKHIRSIDKMTALDILANYTSHQSVILQAQIYHELKWYQAALNVLPYSDDAKLQRAYLHLKLGHLYTAYHLYQELNLEKGINRCKELVMKENTETRHKTNVYIDELQTVQLSRNFSWVIPFQLAGISIPKRKEEIEAFKFMGIGLVVSVLEEERLPVGWFDEDIQNIHYDVVNYKPPTMDDLVEAIKEMEKDIQNGKGVVVHCGGGKGRAGTFLACYIIKNGLDGQIHNEGAQMSGSKAIDLLRRLRPGSIETKDQEDFIKAYANYLWSNV